MGPPPWRPDSEFAGVQEHQLKGIKDLGEKGKGSSVAWAFLGAPSRGPSLGQLLSAASATRPPAAPHLCQYLFLYQPPAAWYLLKGQEQTWPTLLSASCLAFLCGPPGL